MILGERVLGLAQDGDWVWIVAVDQPSHKDPRGYPGWVRRSGLVKGWRQADRFAVVMVKDSLGRDEPRSNSIVVQRMSLDMRLADNSQTPPALESFYNTAQQLLKVPYLWGGTASNALDCSGFFYRLYHAYGYTLPRDADDQAVYGTQVDPQSLRRDDLIFTSNKKGGAVTHVVMVWENGMIIDEDSPKGLTIHRLNFYALATW